MDNGNLVALIKTDDFYGHVEGDVEEIYDKSNYDERKRKIQLQAGKNKKTNWLDKTLGGWKNRYKTCST